MNFWRIETMLKTLTVEEDGKVALPNEVLIRYGFAPNTPVRIIETQSGVLLIPLTDEPMSAALKAEIEEWQALGAESLERFQSDCR
jgi:bifunctional DNA-binding transcriptional regulator/antitoxin component of YhaV-PrlF toxin-antitoxin module